MKLHQLFEAITPPTGVITAYHGGSGFEGDFNMNFSGSGEGYRILGPGMYFTTSKASAETYAKKYAMTKPTVYTAQIDLKNFYNYSAAFTPELKASLASLSKDLGFEPPKMMPHNPRNSLRDGKGELGITVELVGHNKARELLVKNGIGGATDYLDVDLWEICVFDPSLIKIVARDPIEGAKGRDEIAKEQGEGDEEDWSWMDPH